MQVLKGKEVLLIDDDPSFRLLTRRILEADGATFVEAETIQKGLELARAHIPHLIILDLVLPESDGFDFLDQRQMIKELSNTPILVLSGQHDVQSIHRAISLGAKDYLLKPFRANFLLQKVRKALHTTAFLSYTFPENIQPVVSVTTSVDIIKANEVGFLFEGPLKLGPEARVQVTSPLLDHLSCTDCLMMSTSNPAQYIATGRYRNEINLIGITKSLAKNMRGLFKEWK